MDRRTSLSSAIMLPNMSIEGEIVKATVPAVAKETSGILSDLVKRMFGPAADEIGEMWRDKVKLYRYGRQLKCVEKAEKIAQEAGFTPQAVPPKILFPLLEGVSYEGNEELHTMWASLLANASSPDHAGQVRPGFLATLTQMAPDEASLLNWLVQSGFRWSADYYQLINGYVELFSGPETRSTLHEQVIESQGF